MIRLIEEAFEFQQFVESKGWDFYFVGGIAVQIWGEPRLTRDIDLHVFTNFQDEEGFLSSITSVYKPKFGDAERFALTERILPVISPTGVTIDVILMGFADLSNSLVRSTYQPFTDSVSLNICSPSDLIILKTIAGRDRDWGDVESVLRKQRDLDWDYIENTIKRLFEHDDDLPGNYEYLMLKKNEFYRP